MIEKRTLREQVRDELVDWIGAGRLKPGERLEEARLIRELGVGRTPLREALIALEREGLVQSVANRGFSVMPHSIEQVRQLYPILCVLESLAVRTCEVAPEAHAARLRVLVARIDEAKDAKALYAADLAFHEALISGTKNAELLAEIARIRRRAQLYDGAWERGLAEVEESMREHDGIAAEVANGDYEKAAERLEAHWRGGVDIVARWIENNDRKTP